MPVIASSAGSLGPDISASCPDGVPLPLPGQRAPWALWEGACVLGTDVPQAGKRLKALVQAPALMGAGALGKFWNVQVYAFFLTWRTVIIHGVAS